MRIPVRPRFGVFKLQTIIIPGDPHNALVGHGIDDVVNSDPNP